MDLNVFRPALGASREQVKARYEPGPSARTLVILAVSSQWEWYWLIPRCLWLLLVRMSASLLLVCAWTGNSSFYRHLGCLCSGSDLRLINQ